MPPLCPSMSADLSAGMLGRRDLLARLKGDSIHLLIGESKHWPSIETPLPPLLQIAVVAIVDHHRRRRHRLRRRHHSQWQTVKIAWQNRASAMIHCSLIAAVAGAHQPQPPEFEPVTDAEQLNYYCVSFYYCCNDCVWNLDHVPDDGVH